MDQFLPKFMLAIQERVQIDNNGCWLWTGWINPDGYGLIRIDNTRMRAHRLSWTLFHGPIPDNLTIDHLCRIRHCINPEHLEPVTGAENIRRDLEFRKVGQYKTHCSKGHKITPRTLSHHGSGYHCRICVRWHREIEDEIDNGELWFCHASGPAGFLSPKYKREILVAGMHFRSVLEFLNSGIHPDPVSAIRVGLNALYAQHPDLADALRRTGTALLRYECIADAFLGIGRRGDGQNWIGRVHMEIRTQLLEGLQ